MSGKHNRECCVCTFAGHKSLFKFWKSEKIRGRIVDLFRCIGCR